MWHQTHQVYPAATQRHISMALHILVLVSMQCQQCCKKHYSECQIDALEHACIQSLLQQCQLDARQLAHFLIRWGRLVGCNLDFILFYKREEKDNDIWQLYNTKLGMHPSLSINCLQLLCTPCLQRIVMSYSWAMMLKPFRGAKQSKPCMI